MQCETGFSFWKRKSYKLDIEIFNYIIDTKYRGLKRFISYEIQTEVKF